MRIYSVNIHKIILHIYAFVWNIFVWLFTIHLALCYSFRRSTMKSTVVGKTPSKGSFREVSKEKTSLLLRGRGTACGGRSS